MNALHRIWTGRRVPLLDAQPRILVVDDHESAADALVMYLQLENLDARAAYGGRASIDIASAWRPHLIVMDISMPSCDGFAASLALRQDARTCGIAIIAFTALDESFVRGQIKDHEFDAYCQKGQPLEGLTAVLNEMIKRP